jgi:hypothetical protein
VFQHAQRQEELLGHQVVAELVDVAHHLGQRGSFLPGRVGLRRHRAFLTWPSSRPPISCQSWAISRAL